MTTNSQDFSPENVMHDEATFLMRTDNGAHIIAAVTLSEDDYSISGWCWRYEVSSFTGSSWYENESDGLWDFEDARDVFAEMRLPSEAYSGNLEVRVLDDSRVYWELVNQGRDFTDMEWDVAETYR